MSKCKMFKTNEEKMAKLLINMTQSRVGLHLNSLFYS